MAWCPHCGAGIQIPLPVEPLYSLETAAALIPAKLESMSRMLNKRAKHLIGPPLYRWWGQRQHRLLRASDIVALRDHYVTGKLVAGGLSKRRAKSKEAQLARQPIEPTDPSERQSP